MTTLPAVVRIIDLPVNTTVLGGELIEAIQTVGGTSISVQMPLSAFMTTAFGTLPTGGATGQLLNKTSGANFSTGWSSINSFVLVNGTTLATSGAATAIVVNIASGGVGSNQLGTFAVQSLNVATNAIGNVQIRQGSPLSIIGVAGAATANVADITATGALQVLQVNAAGNGLAFTTIVQGSAFLGITNTGIFAQSGTVLATGTFGIVGTTLVTGLFGVVGTSQFTGAFNIAGTTLITGTLGQVGTSLMTGLFGITGTTNITGFLTNVGSAIFTGGTFGVNATAAFTGVFGQVGTSLMTGRFGVVGTALFTSGTFGVVGTSQFTGTFGIAGTTNITGKLGLNSLTGGVLVASSTGVVSNQGGMVLLKTLSPSGVASTNDTTSFSATYRTYMFVLDDVAPANNTVTLQMTVATSGSNFISGSYQSLVSNALVGSQTSTSAILLTGSGATASVSSSTIYGINGILYLHNPAGTVARKFVDGLLTYASASASIGTASITLNTIVGFYDGLSNAVTGVNFAFSAGNIATGTIKIYGIT